MEHKRFVPGTKQSITIENTWYKEQKEDNSHVIIGVAFIMLIVLSKVILMF